MPFFFPEVKAVELITKNVYGLRILPAFQRDESRLPVSPTSFVQYRDPANISPDSGKAAFTDWYYSFKGYKFIGNDGRGFLSPLILERTDKRGVDPLFDCYHLARNSKDNRPEWFALTEKVGDEKNATLEKYRVFCAMNVVLQAEQNLVNRIAVVTKASLDHMKEHLDVLCSRQDQPNDPDWPDFLLGDVTSPYHGLWATVQKGKFNTAGMEASLFKFSGSKDRLINAVKYPVDPNSAWGQEMLAGRYDIGDLERVTRIATAQEILEYIVNDGFLPIELVQEACGPFWDVPESKARRTSAPTAYQEAPAGGGSFAPRPPVAQAAAPAPMAAPSGRQFWVVLPNGTVSAQAMPEAIVRSMVAQNRQNLQVMLVGEQAWKTAQDFGILVPVAPAPAPAPAPVPAAPPAAPQPPRMPAPAGPRVIAPGAPTPLPPPGSSPVAPPPMPPGAPAMAQRPVTPPPPAAQRPAPVQPAAPMAPPAAPVAPPAAPTAPAAAPTAPAAPQPPAANQPVQALSPAEVTEYQELEQLWMQQCAAGQAMPPDKLTRYAELADRYSASLATAQ